MYIVHLYTLIYIFLIYMYFPGPDYVLCRKICSLIGSLDADQEGFDQMPLLHHFDITAKMYLSQIYKYICLKLLIGSLAAGQEGSDEMRCIA